VCVCAFSLHRESPDMIFGDKPLISDVVLSHSCRCRPCRRRSPSRWCHCHQSGVTGWIPPQKRPSRPMRSHRTVVIIIIVVVTARPSLLRRRCRHLFFLVDIIAFLLRGSNWTTPSNGIFSVTSVSIPVYMESSVTIPMRHMHDCAVKRHDA
jgi:hypothetical protein